MKYPHIDDLECCPHCGSDFAFYQRYYAHGILTDRVLFENREPYNTDMYDGLRSGENSDYFCDECDKKIATVKSSPKREQA